MIGACFTAGTQVVVGIEFDENDVFVQYVTKNIEDIKVGDFVYSYDTITGMVELKEVTATFVREVDHINYLTILDEFGNEQVIATTDSHPFWVVTDEPDLERAARGTVDENGVILYHENIDPGLNGFWVEAKDLREGDVFLGANGELLTLVSQERVEFEESITVYNFTVDGNHNYFVIAAEDEFGQTCVLVHNAGYTGPTFLQKVWAFGGHFWSELGPAYTRNLDNIQTTLDAAGFVIPPADLVNAVICTARGDYVGAGVNVIATVPLFGDGAKAAYMTDKLGRTIRNSHLAGKAHPVTGVPFCKDGYPDFSKFSVKDVKINVTGDNAKDFAAANQAAGFKKTPDNMTWHHHQDGTTMQLVPTKIHMRTGHTGPP